jgi:ubiquinone/menaquinone biosynthesis C-methylase UbiE
LQRKTASNRSASPWYRLIRIGFRLLYNELAWTYDTVSWFVSLGQWRDWQQVALPFLKGRQILELAHGPGHMLVALRLAGHEVVGADLSPAMGRLAKKRLDSQELHVPLVRAAAQDLPFASRCFDSALATFPTEFIAESRTIAALYRVLRPGGRLVIVPEARLTGGDPLTSIIEWLYTVTGQRQGFDGSEEPSALWPGVAEQLAHAGFDPSIEQVDLGRSLVTLILAEKKAIDEVMSRKRLP